MAEFNCWQMLADLTELSQNGQVCDCMGTLLPDTLSTHKSGGLVSCFGLAARC